MRYFPQGLVEVNKSVIDRRKNAGDGHGYFRDGLENNAYTQQYTNYPTECLEFSRDKEKLHPTQKPVDLVEYLIRTYTKESDLVLDNCMGSGTTAIACINTNRRYIGFEIDEKYFEIAVNRIGNII